MKPTTKLKIKIAFNNLVFLLVIGMLYLSISWFYIGFHNADLAFNMLSISNQIKAKGIDIGNIFEIRDKDLKGEETSLLMLYRSGMIGMRNAFIMIFISSLFLGYYVHDFKKIQEEKWDKNKRK